jgi:hypothetical protein
MTTGQTLEHQIRLHTLRADPTTLRRLRTAIMVQTISVDGLLIDRRVILSPDLAVPKGEVHAFDANGILIAKHRLPEHLL